MRTAVLAAILLTQAQQPAAPPPATDIWLARLSPTGAIEQPINITAHPGYDNQPSFTPDGKALLFTSRREGEQTEIYQYDFTSRSSAVTRVTRTPESEYSPTPTPDGTAISVIRVEPDGLPASARLPGAQGLQRLWRFTRDGQSPAIILRDIKPVGYHAWGPDGLLALYVLGKPNSLQVADTRTGKAVVVAQNIGRSLHRIPGRETVSVLHNDPGGRPGSPKSGEGGPTIKELNLKTRTLTPIVHPIESKDGDYAWTPDGAILMSDGKTLFRWEKGGDWKQVANLAALGLRAVSRMSVSPDGRWLAVVAAE